MEKSTYPLRKLIDTRKTEFNGEDFWSLYKRIMEKNKNHPSPSAFRSALDNLGKFDEKEKASLFVILGLFYATHNYHWR